MPIDRLRVSLVSRNEPFRGPSSSARLNDEMQEILRDLAALTAEWNGNLFPLLDALPKGDGTPDPRYPNATGMPNPWTNGFDGSNFFIDNNAEPNSDSGRFWNELQNRPVTPKELHLKIVDELRILEESLLEQINQFSDVLTDEQKARIGENIFDPTKISNSTSLDGVSKLNSFNIAQLARDLYGPSPLLDGDGQGNLKQAVTNATLSVRQIVNAVLALHNGSWTSDNNIDNTVSHNLFNADIDPNAAIAQTKIAQSNTINDTFVGSPVNLLEDLNKLRTVIRNHTGSTAWDALVAVPYSGGPQTLRGHMIDFGTGTPDATNPHGLDLRDLDDGDGLLLASNEASEISYVPNGTQVIQPTDTNVQLALDTLDVELFNHLGDFTNPHNVTAVQIGGTNIITELNQGSTVGVIQGTHLGVDTNATFLVEHNSDGTHSGKIGLADSDIPPTITRDTEVPGLAEPLIDQKITDALGEGRRLEIPFFNNTNPATPIVVTHNKNFYPIVQVLDTAIDISYPYEDAGLVDEGTGQVGAYGGESVEFVSVQHINRNVFHVYTSVVRGYIVALF